MKERVRILEKDFPGGIPKDIGDKPLEDFNEAGETQAIYTNISLLLPNKRDKLDSFHELDKLVADYRWYIEDMPDETGQVSLDEILEGFSAINKEMVPDYDDFSSNDGNSHLHSGLLFSLKISSSIV